MTHQKRRQSQLEKNLFILIDKENIAAATKDDGSDDWEKNLFRSQNVKNEQRRHKANFRDFPQALFKEKGAYKIDNSDNTVNSKD